MTEIHQTLKFGDLPLGTKFQHPKTNEVYTKDFSNWPYNSSGPSRIFVSDDVVVTLTNSIDFFSIELSAKFAYDQKVYTKIARNRARHGTDVKYFEPDDSVSPL